MSGKTAYYMRGTSDVPAVEIVIDPTDNYKHVGQQRVADALGLIPAMFLRTSRAPLAKLPLWEAMDEQYKHGGGLYNMTNADKHILERNGVLKYGDYDADPDESDPPLFPLAKYIRTMPEGEEEIMWQYESGIIAIQKVDFSFRVSRMD